MTSTIPQLKIKIEVGKTYLNARQERVEITDRICIPTVDGNKVFCERCVFYGLNQDSGMRLSYFEDGTWVAGMPDENLIQEVGE